MLTSYFRFLSSVVCSEILKSIHCKPLPLFRKNMDLELKLQLSEAFKYIQDLKNQVQKIKSDLTNVEESLLRVEKLPIFQNIQKTKFQDDTVDNTKKMKFDFPVENGYVVVYTDGACESNGFINAKAGIGVWFCDNHPCNVSKPVEGKATNNTAEIQACINAVEIVRSHGIQKLKIITDSQFVINSMTKWINNWRQSGWMLAGGKKEVKNKIDFHKLDQLCQGMEIIWEHVPGHRGILGNERADELAREGAKLYKSFK